MQESFIQQVTRETMQRIRSEAGGKREILLIFTGGDRAVDESLAQVKSLANGGLKFVAYLSPAAERIIGRDKVLNAGVSSILADSEVWDKGILDRVEGVVIPVLTMNTLSKTANMIADNPATNIILLAARFQKRIIAASDSIIPAGGPELSATSSVMRKINEMINSLRNMGIRVVSAKNLAREVAEALNVKTGALSPLANAGYSSICDVSIEDCIECGLCVENRPEDVREIIAAGATRVSSKPLSKPVGDLARYIDHTLLKAEATQEQIGELCEDAKRYKFATVCVNPANVKLASQLLSGSGVGVTTVIGFPLGATTPTVKALEARDAIANGADEIDMVINVGALKSGNLRLVEDDIRAVREATRGKVLKVILETGALSKEQIVTGSQLSKIAGADFVKTSTGFGPGGATAEDVALMRKTVGPQMGVKASGGIRTTQDVNDMIGAGATRIGASASVAIVSGGGDTGDGY
ncbi:MAG: deoxyribose-phosphate aldolase [Elusimicrobia bacterium]|nr:deoxyribose-phosphate aldolase [Elusimicrobiota bacterium]